MKRWPTGVCPVAQRGSNAGLIMTNLKSLKARPMSKHPPDTRYRGNEDVNDAVSFAGSTE